jgi:hypothetical protein
VPFCGASDRVGRPHHKRADGHRPRADDEGAKTLLTTLCTTPVRRIAELGLLDGDDTRGEQLTAAQVEEFRLRQRPFDRLHLGTTDVPVGRLLALLESDPVLRPPRTGHLGNWEEIVQGRAGAMDFNKAICARGLGYPLIYCFNQTEDDALLAGDWVYLPGSLVEHGRRTELPLFTWDGARCIRRTREVPLFTPFVLTEVDGGLVPIVEVHWSRMRRFQEFDFRLEAAAIREHEPLVRAILHVLLEEAAVQENPRRSFQDLLSHQVALDGRIWRCELQREAGSYRMGGASYATTDELVEAAMLPFLAATEPERFFAQLPDLPRHLPVMSNVLASMLSALLSTHYPGCRIERATMTQPFNPHFHWGARDMAGYPPRRKGYFAERSTAKSGRKICQVIVDRFASVDPILFVLMPAAIFMLCPADAYPRDSDLVSELIHSVRQATEGLADRPESMMAAVDSAVQRWLERATHALSGYFLNRFGARRGVLNAGELPTYSDPVEPEGFRELTLRQACMIVGALAEAVAADGTQ